MTALGAVSRRDMMVIRNACEKIARYMTESTRQNVIRGMEKSLRHMARVDYQGVLLFDSSVPSKSHAHGTYRAVEPVSRLESTNCTSQTANTPTAASPDDDDGGGDDDGEPARRPLTQSSLPPRPYLSRIFATFLNGRAAQ